VPRQAGSDTDWESIAIGESHIFGIKTGGDGYCAGSSYHGKCGTGIETTLYSHTLFAAQHKWTKLVASPYFSCGLTDAAKLFCWGLNHYGQLGQPSAWADEIMKAAEP
jgi:alpha-tubulin suppressor-like RCC1 family protein